MGRKSGEGRLGRVEWGEKSGEGSGSLARRQLAKVLTAPAPADESCATADHRLAHPPTTSCSDPVYMSHIAQYSIRYSIRCSMRYVISYTALGESSGTTSGTASGAA